MSAADYADSEIVFRFTVTQELAVALPFADMARALKVSKKTLANVLDGNDDLDEIDDQIFIKLRPDAETEDETLEFVSVEEG